MKLAIVTKNAIHGGVETLIALHQQLFRADVFVAGGYHVPETCPFEYTYMKDAPELTEALLAYDVIEYHWPPAWAVEAIRQANRPSVEVVHRIDTSECDKSVPTVLVAHSYYLAGFLRDRYARDTVVIPHAIDLDRFRSVSNKGPYIGALTSYYQTKGIDLFLEAWDQLQESFPNQKVRFCGAGSDLPTYQQMVADFGMRNVDLLGPASPPERYLGQYSLYLVPSRIEGMPLAILEALASNVPVLCSSLPGMVEFNRLAIERGYEAPLFVFESENVDDLVLKLRQILSKPDISRNTRDYIARFYNPAIQKEAYQGVFRQAIEIHRLFGSPVYQAGSRAAAPSLFTPVEAEDIQFMAAIARRLRTSSIYPLMCSLGRRVLK